MKTILFIVSAFVTFALVSGCATTMQTVLEAPQGKTTLEAAKDEAKCRTKLYELPVRRDHFGEPIHYEQAYYVECMRSHGYTAKEVASE